MATTKEFNISSNAVTVLNQTADAAENTAKGFTSAKAELRALQQQLLQMDQSSEEFKKASARAAELKDNISDLSAEISANAGNAFEGLSNNVSLFGSRLMDLDLKGAGQALTAMGGAVGRIDFKTLKDEVGGLVTGIGNLGKALLSNPILLFAAAVTASIVYFKELKTIFEDLTMTSEKMNNRLMKSQQVLEEVGKAQVVTENIKLLTRVVQDHTKSEEDRKKALDKLNVAFKANNIQTVSNINNTDQLTKSTDSLIVKLVKEAEVRGKMAYLQELYAKKTKLAAESTQGITSGLLLNLELTARTSNNLQAKLAQGIVDVFSSSTLSDIENISNQIKLVEENILSSSEAISQIDISGAIPPPPPEPPKPKKVKEKREELGEVYDMEVEWNLKLVNEEKIKQDKLTELAMQGHKTRLLFTEEYKNAVIAAENQLYQARWTLANASIDLLGTLFQKNKKAADVAFVLQKALAIGQVVVDTQREIAGYYANPTWKLSPDGGIALATAASTAAKLRAAASIATIAGTTIGKFMGGGSANLGGNTGAGVGGGGTQAPSPANFAFLGNQPNQQQPPLQAYIVGAQVSSNLEAQQLIQNQSRLGG